MTTEDYGLARRMWHQLEPVHAVFWYAPQVFAEAAGLGYEVQTRWPSYFAWRLAQLGPAGPRDACACGSVTLPPSVAAGPGAGTGVSLVVLRWGSTDNLDNGPGQDAGRAAARV